MKLVVTLLCAAALLSGQGAPRRAPSFCLSDTTGQWRDLLDYRGKVVIVEFMQTTCPHCAAFAPKLSDLQKKYAGKLQVLAIALPPDNPSTMMDFVKGHNLAYPLLLDMGQVAVSYVRVPNLHFPHIYLLDGEGMIRGTWEEGPLAKDIFEGNGLAKEIDRLLAPSTPAAPAKKK
jgi:peroxiredoxin